MTRDQMATCIRLDTEGLIQLELQISRLKAAIDYAELPIPGLQLFVNVGQTKLLMVLPDGSHIDLLEVHRLAEDLVRNWRKDESGKSIPMPAFVGDWPRLAKVLNGTPAPKEGP